MNIITPSEKVELVNRYSWLIRGARKKMVKEKMKGRDHKVWREWVGQQILHLRWARDMNIA